MKICIDPGHGLSSSKPGLYDPGACSGSYQEASLALIWSHALRVACEDLGLSVFMTRTDASEAAPLGQRVARAQKAGCTHFLSIHLNASDSPQANGVEVLYEGSPKAKFAQGIQNLLVRELKLRDRKTKWASVDLKRTLAVLRFPGPVALLELGFITCQQDRDVVMNAEVMHRTCKALATHMAALSA